MYAIIETGGKQFWVSPGDVVRVEKLTAEAGTELQLKALWAAGEPGAAQAQGLPSPGSWLPSAQVTIEVLRHFRAPKVLVFKKRTKKAYQKTAGHRQDLTEIRVKDISLN